MESLTKSFKGSAQAVAAPKQQFNHNMMLFMENRQPFPVIKHGKPP